MYKLIEGLQRFQSDIVPERREQMARLASGQNPLALFITCSDSRIVPDLILQSEPGELFVLRNAGNIVPPYNPAGGSEGGTIEYAVSVLGVNDIIVCGHTGCGAMKALLHPESVAETPQIAAWLQQAEPTRRVIQEMDRKSAGLSTGSNEKAKLDVMVQRNVQQQLNNLRTHPAVSAALALGTLRLHGWVYDIELGDMTVYDTGEARFLPVNSFYTRARTTVSV